MPTTSDPAIAQSFLDHRHSDGRQYLAIAPLPHRVPGSITITTPNSPPKGALFRAQEMEDKWDIFHLGGRLHAARSWTGQLHYQCKISFEDGISIIDDIRSLREEGDHLRRELHFLLVWSRQPGRLRSNRTCVISIS